MINNCPWCNSKNVAMVQRYVGWSGYCVDCDSYGTTDKEYEEAIYKWNITIVREDK